MVEFSAAWWWIDRWRKSTAYTDMTLEEQGAYRNLLDELWLRGGVLPKNDRILAKISGDALAWEKVRTAVLARFYESPEGWRNSTHDDVQARAKERMEFHSRGGKARMATAKRDANGRLLPSNPSSSPPSKQDQQAGQQADVPANLPPSPSPSPISGSVSEEKKDLPSLRSERSCRDSRKRKPRRAPSTEALAIAEHLRDAILSHSPEHRCGRNGAHAKWATDIDRALRLDGRTPNGLAQVIRWAHQSREGEFWRANLQSGAKLRAQYDVIAAQMARGHTEDAEIEAWVKGERA